MGWVLSADWLIVVGLANNGAHLKRPPWLGTSVGDTLVLQIHFWPMRVDDN